ncbi:MAG: hypothetical protein E6I88_14150 [Chloroflexi bacterium]|nr:MAG: hypothetical protein E6I88_14150 [Chloroflexota bacterium]
MSATEANQTVEMDASMGGRPSTLGRLGANVSALFGSQVATWSMTLLWTLIVPRALGPAGMGLLVMAWSTSSLLSILGGLSSKTLLVKEIAAHPERGPGLLGAAMVVRTASIIPCLALTFAYIRFGHFTGEEVVVLWMAALIAISILFLEPFQAGFQAIERPAASPDPLGGRPASDHHTGHAKSQLLGLPIFLHLLPLDRLHDSHPHVAANRRWLVRRIDEALHHAPFRPHDHRDRLASAAGGRLCGVAGAFAGDGTNARGTRSHHHAAGQRRRGADGAQRHQPALRRGLFACRPRAHPAVDHPAADGAEHDRLQHPGREQPAVGVDRRARRGLHPQPRAEHRARPAHPGTVRQRCHRSGSKPADYRSGHRRAGGPDRARIHRPARAEPHRPGGAGDSRHGCRGGDAG